MKSPHTWLRTFVAFVLLSGFAATALADEDKDESGKHKGPRWEKRYEGKHYENEQNDGSYFHRHGRANLGIPAGHLPPPGECRVWHPDRPAGHQPPPGDCRHLSHRVPLGAWLIYRSEDDPEHVDVSVYDERRPGIVEIIGEFILETGEFVRERQPR